MQAVLAVLLCVNSLHVLNSKVISSTETPGYAVGKPAPPNEHQPGSQTNQSSYVLIEMQNVINGLQEENERLRLVKIKMKRECDVKFEQSLKIYNDLYNNIETDIPVIRALEGNISIEMLKDESLKKAIKEVKGYLDVLKFKKVNMIIDIQALQARQRQDYQTCVQLGSYFGFTPENDVGTRSFGKETVSGKTDVETIIFERKKVWLEIKQNQETFQNTELKKFIEYYSGYCQRRIEKIKLLVEDLKKYPKASGMKDLEDELSRLKMDVQKSSSVLQPLEKQLEEVASEVKALQPQYDGLQNTADCFMNLGGWHINNVVKQYENIANKIESMDFSDMEINSQQLGQPIELVMSNDSPTDVTLPPEPVTENTADKEITPAAA